MKKKRIIWSTIIVLIFILLIVTAFDIRLQTVHYEIKSEKVQSQIRLAVVSDLHSCRYGAGQKTLVDAINDQNPDVLLYTGDILDDVMPDDNTVSLLAALQDKYLSYYVTGNHEYWSHESDQKISIMLQYGVRVLRGEWDTVSVNGQTIHICGVDDPDIDRYTVPERSFEEQLQSLEKAADNGAYTILLSHRPELIQEYARYPFDLVLSGHAHGGQWRIPGILHGVCAPNQGWFPQYTGGQYDCDGVTMIVSRGLAKESTRIPRIYNRPELVIVELKGE